VFINLKTDPHIPHSSPHRACVNLPPPIAFGLPLTSTLRCYSGSRLRLCSDTPQTPTHVCTRTLLGLYSEPCSSSVNHPPLRSTRPPHCNPIFTYTDLTRSPVSIRATSSRNSTRTFCSGAHSDIHVSIHLTSPSPRLRTPFRPPSSDPV
jgi:hypothetical protein